MQTATQTASQFQERHRGFSIFRGPLGFYWEDDDYGAESDDYFHNIELARADVDEFLGPDAD